MKVNLKTIGNAFLGVMIPSVVILLRLFVFQNVTIPDNEGWGVIIIFSLFLGVVFLLKAFGTDDEEE